MRIIVFDTETTGLPTKRHAPASDTLSWPHIVQISWIVYDAGTAKIQRAEDHLVKLPEGVVIPEAASKVHGITASQLARKGVDAQVALEAFIKDLRAAERYVAHNLGFDQAVIQASCHRLGISPPFNKDTCRASPYCTAKEGVIETQLWAERKSGSRFLRYPKLWELHQTLFQSNAQNLHDALADVLVCLRCYLQMAHGQDLMTCSRARQLFDLYGIGSNKRRKLSHAR
tara:strand:- start:2159 stop:2845 length:687 start_codon:yes stop_codon:yes gene_type:complete